MCLHAWVLTPHLQHLQQELGVMGFTVGVMSLASIGGAAKWQGCCRLVHTFPSGISSQCAWDSHRDLETMSSPEALEDGVALRVWWQTSSMSHNHTSPQGLWKGSDISCSTVGIWMHQNPTPRTMTCTWQEVGVGWWMKEWEQGM